MLQPPTNRSIGRFLLPMADIMALLFSFFLLLPHLEQEPGRQAGRAVTPGSYWTPAEQERIREELFRFRRQRQLPVDERLSVIVLDIDGQNGDLLLTDAGGVARITDANVEEIIRKHLAAARHDDRELFYLLRLPRPGPAGTPVRPLREDEDRYRRWFGKQRVDYRIDYPKLPG